MNMMNTEELNFCILFSPNSLSSSVCSFHSLAWWSALSTWWLTKNGSGEERNLESKDKLDFSNCFVFWSNKSRSLNILLLYEW